MTGLEIVITFEEVQRKIELLAEKIVRLKSAKVTASIEITGGDSDDKMAAKVARLQELQTRLHYNYMAYTRMKYEIAEILDRGLAI